MTRIVMFLLALVLLPLALPTLAVLLTIALVTYGSWAPVAGWLAFIYFAFRVTKWRVHKTRNHFDAIDPAPREPVHRGDFTVTGR